MEMVWTSNPLLKHDVQFYNETYVVYHWLFSVALDQPRFKAGGYCEVCKMAVNYIDGILEKNATEAEIEEAVRKVCSFLPKSYQTQVSDNIFIAGHF